jgi:hypothetical protein
MFRFSQKIVTTKLQTTLFAILGALSLIAGAVAPVQAQNPSITVKTATLSVYPEYDDPLHLGYPALLVMYEGQFVAPNLSTITFLVPSNASMYSAGSGPRDQYVVGASLNRTASNVSGWDEISFTPQTNYFVVEYYAPIQGAPQRDIPYTFLTEYPVSGLSVIVQVPKRSTNFVVSPQGTLGTDQEGFQGYTYNVPTVTPDQPLTYNISYTKSDTKPSTASPGGTNTVLIIVGAAVVIIIIGAVFIIPMFRSKPSSRPQRRAAERTSAKKVQGKGKFCRNCGKQVQPGDKFCPYCGDSI